MTPIKAVIFDIDGTLTTRISWNYLVEYLGGSPEAEYKNYSDWKKGLITEEEANKKIIELWRTDNRANKSEFDKAFESVPLRPDALDLINYIKSTGKEICLITGAMDMYAAIMAKRLGLDHYYGNTILHWDTNNEIKSFDYNSNQSEKKVEQFKYFCVKLNLKPSECIAVGDSENDYGLFRLTGNGIAVRTQYEDKELEGMAWKVVNNLTEIKKLI